MSTKEQKDKNYDCYIIKDVGQKRGLVAVKINDEEILLTTSSYADHFLYPNKKLTRDEYLNLLGEEKLIKAKKYLSTVLSRNRYTIQEVKNKVRSKFYLDDKKIEALLKEYIESGILDDTSYAFDFIESGQLKGFSFDYLKYKLKQKGIADEIFNKDDILKLRTNDYDSLLNLIIKLNGKNANTPLKSRKEKMINYCLQHGYSYEQVKSCMDEFYSSDLFDLNSNIESEKILMNKKIVEFYNSLKNKGYSDKELKNKLVTKLINKGFKYSDIIQEIEKENLLHD